MVAVGNHAAVPMQTLGIAASGLGSCQYYRFSLGPEPPGPEASQPSEVPVTTSYSSWLLTAFSQLLLPISHHLPASLLLPVLSTLKLVSYL